VKEWLNQELDWRRLQKLGGDTMSIVRAD
jgi:hypothetical protein